MNGLSRRQAALLAALLDADGATVPYPELGDVVGAAGVNVPLVISQYVNRLRRLGVGCVVVVPGVGLRLAGLPPDWALEDVLALLDEMRRDGFEQPVLRWGRAS
jgi:hypothetical protein